MTEYVRVRKPFAVFVGNRPMVYKAGQVVSTDDPGYPNNVGNFEMMDEREQRRERGVRAATVERATANPGERRPVSAPRPQSEQSAARVRAAQPGPEVHDRDDDDGDDGGSDAADRPADYASKGAWLDYAMKVARSRGDDTTREQLDANYTKPELVSRYG